MINSLFLRKYSPVIIPAIIVIGIVLLVSIKFSTKPTGLSTQAAICDYYASPTGSPVGLGTVDSPWDLQSALNKSATIVSGKTLCLKGGTYNGKYKSNLNGGTVRSVPGEWAKIDGYKTTTLTAPIGVSDNSIPVADVSGWPAENLLFEIAIDNEVVRILGRNGNNFTVYDRGASGSGNGAEAHGSGAIVSLAGDNLYIAGNNTTFRDFEVMSSDPIREQSASFARTWGRGGVAVVGSGNKVINLVIHDGLSGIFTSSASSDTELYGNIIYNNGFNTVGGGGAGHGMYLENSAGFSKVYNNIVYNSYNLGIQTYGRTAPYVGGDLQDNVWANSGAPHGTPNRNGVFGPEAQQIPTINLERNHFYHQPGTNGYGLIIGYGAGIANATFNGNYVVAADNAAMVVENTGNLTGSGNHFYGQGVSYASYLQMSGFGNFDWNNNTYHKAGTAGVFAIPGTGVYDFTQWKSTTGLDSTSTATSIDIPNQVIIRPNAYEAGRANVYIYTTSGNTANIDLSQAGLTNGQSYEIRNAQNYMGQVVASGTYNSSSPNITVNLSGAAAAVAQPIGGSVQVTTTCPQFCPMVIVPTSTGGTPTPSVPVISSFTANPSTVTSGQASTLSWSVTGATTLSINNSIGTVTGTSVSVSPATTMTYTLTATNSNGSVTATTTVTVNGAPVGTPCTGVNCITIDGSQIFQTMNGWEATSWAGSDFPGQWGSYVDEILTKSVEDLGINRIRLEILSGVENPIDGWEQWRTCTNTADICKNQWRSMRYNAVNDNTNPGSVNSNGFHFSQFDENIDHLVIPLRQKLQARGEQLYLNVNYVDFAGSTGLHANNPAEYAEFVLNTYQHMQSTYGFVPDSWEVSLEPDNTGANWTPAHLAAAMKAAGDRLVAAGFTPRFVAPSVTNMNNTVSYIDAIASLSGAMQYVDTFSYHLYGGQSDSVLQTIAARAATHNKKTAQLEYIGATYQHLHKDLKIGQNSAWQQYTFGGEGADDGGGYFYVTGGTTVNMGSLAKQLRQYFKYIRKDAVRIGTTNSGNPFIDPLAFRNSNGRHVVVTPVSSTTSFGINGLPAGTYGIFYTTTGFVTTNLPDQTITAGGAVSLSNIPAGVVTVYATTGATPPPNPVPTISSFTASPAGITSGQSSTLSWNVSGATSLSINQGIGNVTGTSRSVSPTTTTTYTLTATNSAGVVTSSVTVTVNPVPSAPTISSFTASPSSVTQGDSSTLSWVVTNATSLSINQGVGVVTGSSRPVSPASTTTYTLTATNTAGSSTANVTITVLAPPNPAPTISSFSANPNIISNGSSSVLSWVVSDATSLSINQGIGAVTGNSRNVSPDSTTTYTLTATNSVGIATATAIITVTITPPADTTPPVISSVLVNQTENEIKKARITWVTDEASDGQIEWGTTTSYGSTSQVIIARVTSHQVVISNLIPNTLYHYRVKSRDAAGNLAVSADRTFTSRARAPKPPRSNTLNFSPGSIVINWGTYEYDLCTAIEVHRSTDSAPQTPTAGTLLTSVECSATGYTDTAVTAGTTYYYSIFIKDDVGVYSDPTSGSFVAPGSTGGGGGGGGGSSGGGGGGNNHPPSNPPVSSNNTPTNPSVILPSNVIAGQVIKFPDSPTIYLVQSTGLHPFDTWSSFQSYQAISGAKIITRTGTASTYTISAVLAKTILEQSASTPITPSPTTNLPAKGTNFTCSGSPTIYYYNNNGGKEAYSELAVWRAWNGSGFSSVTNHPASACSTIAGSSIVRLPEGSFIKVSGGSEIYRIDGTTARPYASYPAYQRDSVGKTTYTISIPYLHTYSRGQEIK